jgi:hypothetical protein
MNIKRTAIIFVAGAAFAAWLSAAIAPGRPPAPRHDIARDPIDATGEALATEVARLRARLRPEPVPRAPVRNPFRFQQPRPSPAAPPVSAAPPQRDTLTAAAVAAPAVRLTLAGIAEDPNPDGGSPLRTAIISGEGQLFLVTEGDVITGGGVEYAIGPISADSVELRDARDGGIRRLSLK